MEPEVLHPPRAAPMTSPSPPTAGAQDHIAPSHSSHSSNSLAPFLLHFSSLKSLPRCHRNKEDFIHGRARELPWGTAAAGHHAPPDLLASLDPRPPVSHACTCSPSPALLASWIEQGAPSQVGHKLQAQRAPSAPAFQVQQRPANHDLSAGPSAIYSSPAQVPGNVSECEDSFVYVCSSTSWIRSSSQ